MLGALGSLGHGLAAIGFGFVAVVPFGWRGLYAAGAVPLLVLAWLRRELPETQRFEAQQNRQAQGSWWRPAVLIPPVVMWLAVPETARRVLEEVSPER